MKTTTGTASGFWALSCVVALTAIALAAHAENGKTAAGGKAGGGKDLTAFVKAIDPELVKPNPVDPGQVVSDSAGTTVKKIDSDKPDVIFVGDSMLYSGIDIQTVAQLTGLKTMWIISGAMSAWQFAVVKNVVGSAAHKPKYVVLVTRYMVITTPNARASGTYRSVIDKISGPPEKEKLLQELAYRRPEIGFPKIKDPALWDFSKVGTDSFLPYMLRIASDQKYTLVIARHRGREVGASPTSPFWNEGVRLKYAADMKAFVEANGGVFLDYVPFEGIGENHFAGGDELNGEGRTIWTARMAADLKELESPERKAAIAAAAKELDERAKAAEAAQKAEELRIQRAEDQKRAVARTAWERGRLQRKVAEAVKAGKKPRIFVSSVNNTVEITRVGMDGTLRATAGNWKADVAWSRLTQKEKAELAVAVAGESDEESCALAAFYLLGQGDKARAETYLARAGAAGEEVRTLFAK